MRKLKLFLLFLCMIGISACSTHQKQEYQPSFESLEQANPVPEWFKDAKFGIYFHWGVYSVPAFMQTNGTREHMYIKGTAEIQTSCGTYGEPNHVAIHQLHYRG